MTIKITDLLVEVVTKKAKVLLEGKYKKRVALKEEESDEEEREVLHRDPETGKLSKKNIKVAREKSMHSTSKQTQAAASAGGNATPSTKPSKKAKPVAAGSKEHAKKMAAAKAEFEEWDKNRAKQKLTAALTGAKSTQVGLGSKEGESIGHERALKRALRAQGKRKKADLRGKEVSEETDAEHAKKLGRDIKRYERGDKAAHKAALAAAKKREARKTGEK